MSGDGERFIRCQHCKLPHAASETVCPVTGAAIAARKKPLKIEAAPPEPVWRMSLHPESVALEDDAAQPGGFLGRVIDDKYRVEELIGVGGMGAVYRAEHLRLARKVAIKVLLRGHRTGSTAEQRFMREAKIASALRHRNIVSILDLGVLKEGTPYQVMELLEGRSLGQQLRQEGALDVEAALRVGIDILSAVGAAHARGVLHRDIKPDNVFLARTSEDEGQTSCAKLVDFGISKSIEKESIVLTRPGSMMGTPIYFAPEQAHGAAADFRTDVYSVGATLYEAITGRPPFVSSNYADLIRQIRTTRPEPIRALLPAIPDAVERAIAKMMEADPEARFQTATAAGRALSEAYTQLLNAATQEIVLPPPATEELSLDALSSDAHPLGPDTDDVTLRFE
jgi:serine/threonine-protein kinase